MALIGETQQPKATDKGPLVDKRTRFEVMRAQLIVERATFIDHWKQCADFHMPRRAKFYLTDTNKGNRRNQNIIDSTGTLCLTTLRAGMMAGISSPSRPWFSLRLPDAFMNNRPDVHEWLEQCTDIMDWIFRKSNLYNTLPILYGDGGLFGTGTMLVEEDFQQVLRFYPLPIGEYMLANDSRGQIQVFVRDFRLTVRQVVEKFGFNGTTGEEKDIDWSKFSTQVKTLWERGQKDIWVNITHIIEPNPEYNPRKMESKYKKYRSVYYERGLESTGQNMDQAGPVDLTIYLEESGYDFFPLLSFIWEKSGTDVYGTSCPGMNALGDVMQMQTGEKRSAQAIDKLVNPPLVGPSSLRTQVVNQLPGGMTFEDGNGTNQLRPLYTVNPQITELEKKQEQVRNRVKDAWFYNLFFATLESDRRDITATEIQERKEEKMMALGSVLEQLNQGVLEPLIKIAWLIGQRQKLFPPPPPDLDGAQPSVEFVSIMAQAQKALGIAILDKFTAYVIQISASDPTAIDNVDIDKLIDEYANRTGTPPTLLRKPDVVQAIRQNRAQAQQQQQVSEKLAQASQTAKNLGQAPTEGGNALSDLIERAKAGQITQ